MSTASDSDTPPLPTYTTLPTKIKCANPRCARDLFYYPPTAVNNVHAPILLACTVCAHTFPTTSLDAATEALAALSLKRTHYDVLGVERSATPDEIARAYRKKSLSCHPDRTKGKEEEWALLTQAYDVLGDKRKRHWYDIELEKGPDAAEATEDPASQVKTDPEKFFQDIFGGERFYDLIGMSSVGRALGEAMLNPGNEPEPEKSAEEKAAEEAKAADERVARIRMLVDNLAYKLDLYALDEDLVGRMDRWRARCKLETDELKNERFGAEILKAVGYVYRIKATTHPLRSEKSWANSISARLTSWSSTYNTFSSILSTVRKAYTVKSAFIALQTAETDPSTTPEQKQALEEKAAKIAIEALWAGVRLEIYDVLKEVCDMVLDVDELGRERVVDRIDALERLGGEFEGARADVSVEEFVHVERAGQ